VETGQQLGHYRIAGKLGAGGMGEVWSAEDTKLGCQVAIKVLPPGMADDPERLARFEREARSLAQLNHANIAAIYGLEEHAGTHFLVLELVPGETLAERIERGPVPPREALGLARQIADGLAAAHAAGILHRDLKPANVKVTPDGKVKVLDFGLAKPFQPDPAVSGADASLSPTVTFAGATQAGVLLGTAAYMAPEQARGHALDRRADIWALGVILFEMLTGKRMFSGGTVSDTLASVLKEEPRWDALPVGVSAAARRLLRRTLAKDPARRLHDVGDVVLEIDDALVEPEDDDALAAPPARRRLASLAGWLLFVASAIAIVVLAVRPGAAPSRPPVHAAIPSPPGTT
jgi:serine/threonine protein kinase